MKVTDEHLGFIWDIYNGTQFSTPVEQTGIFPAFVPDTGPRERDGMVLAGNLIGSALTPPNHPLHNKGYYLLQITLRDRDAQQNVQIPCDLLNVTDVKSGTVAECHPLMGIEGVCFGPLFYAKTYRITVNA